MSREHSTYWLSTEESNGKEVGQDCYYLKDARREAQKLANEINSDVFVNQRDDIIDVISPNYKKRAKK